MEWKNNIVSDFLKSIDVHNIDENNNSFISLAFDNGAEFNVDLKEQGALLTMINSVNLNQEEYIYEKILVLANHKNNYNNFIQVIIPEDHKIGIALFLDDTSFSLQNIEKTIEHMQDIFQKIEY